MGASPSAGPGRRRRHPRRGRRRSASPAAAATSGPARPRACSSATPGSCPASSCGSTTTRPSPWRPRPPTPFSATFVLRSQTRPGAAESSLMVFRYRYVGRGMREDLVLHNYGEEAAYCSVELAFGADFANLFRVKEGAVAGRGQRGAAHVGDRPGLRLPPGAHHQGAAGDGQRAGPGPVVHPPLRAGDPGPRRAGRLCLQFTPVIEGDEIEPRYLCGQPVEQATPTQRLDQWRSIVPRVETDFEDLRKVVARSAEDLGALRIFDPDHPERTVVAAGAPWFMTLFGRDSLLTVVDGAARRPRPGPGRAADPGPLPGHQGRPPPGRGAGQASSTRCASARRRRCRWAGATSTTGRPTPPRCS